MTELDFAGTGFASLSMLDYVLIAIATFIASLISGIGGFGGGIVIAITVTPIVGAKSVLPLISVFAFFSNLSRVYAYRHSINFRLAIGFLLASVPGLWLGITFFQWVSEDLLVMLLGITMISAIPLRRVLKETKFKTSIVSVLIMGSIFGFVSGTAIGSGLLVISTLVSSGLQGHLLLGTDAVIGILNSAMRMIAFRQLGMLTDELFIIGSIMGVMTLPGTYLARAIINKIGASLHTIFIEMVILLGGFGFIIQAFW